MNFKEVIDLLFSYKTTFLFITIILVVINGMFALQLKYIFKILDNSYKKHDNTHMLLEFIMTILSKITYLSADSIIKLLNTMNKESDKELIEMILRGVASNKYNSDDKDTSDVRKVRKIDQKYLFKNKKDSNVDDNIHTIIQDLINDPDKLNDFIEYKQKLTEK